MNKISKSEIKLGTGLVVLSSLFYASYGIWTTLIGNFFGAYTASALRSVLVLMILLPMAYMRRELEPINLKKNWKQLFSMIFASTLVWGLLYYSILNVGIGISLSVNYSALVIGMVLFGWLLAGEKVTNKIKLSVVLGLIGLSLIFMQSSSGSIGLWPLVAAVISGLAGAANTVIAKQLPYNSTQSTMAMWATSIIANFPLIFITNEIIPPLGFEIEWFYLVVFAICSVLSTWSLMKGLKYIEAGLAGILGLLEIVFGVLFGIILFNENLELLTILGVIVILFASVFPYLNRKYENDNA